MARALDKQVIADAALQVLAEFGLGDLSMRRLARELGVGASALYWHVENKQELLGLVGQRFARLVDERCPASAHPDPRLVCVALRDVLRGFRDGAEIHVTAYALLGDAVVPEALRAPGDLPAPRVRALMAFVLGHVQLEQTRELLGVRAPGDADDEDFLSGLDIVLGPVPVAE